MAGCGWYACCVGMSALESRLALLFPCVLALGFVAGMNLSPRLQHQRRDFVNTYFFVGKFARAELFRAGLQRPEPEDLGTYTSGPRAELAIPVETKAKSDLELLIEYSLNPRLGDRMIEITVNGEKIAEWRVAQGKRRLAHALRVPSDLWRPGQPLDMTMTAKSPPPAHPADRHPAPPELGMILHAVSVYQMS